MAHSGVFYIFERR